MSRGPGSSPKGSSSPGSSPKGSSSPGSSPKGSSSPGSSPKGAPTAPTLVVEAGRDPEAVFVARLRARDETAFNELMELYQHRVFALVYRMLGRRAEAEDVTQDTFVNVFRSIETFRGDAKLSTFLFRVAVNLSKNRIKQNARRGGGRHQDVDGIAEHTELSAAQGVSVGSVERPDELMEGMQLERIVKLALAELEPEFRELVILRDVEDLSYEEIAEVTELPAGTVKSRIHRGRAQLRARVDRIMGKMGKGKHG